MKEDYDQNEDDGRRGDSKRDRLRRKLEQWHDLHSLQHLQRMQFGQRGFLRPQVLQLLEKQPMNGVDIMNELQEMSHGWYRPSPGSIYPLLEQLEKEGLIAKNKDGKFELTPAFVERSGIGDDVGSVLSDMESNASYLEYLRGTGGKGLSKHADRIERLSRRLGTLSGELR